TLKELGPHFHRRPHPMPAHVHNPVAHAEQQWANRFQIRIFAANPKDKFSLRCDFRGPRDRCIDKTNLPRRSSRSHLLGERWVNRTAINPKRVWPKMIQKAART